MKVFHVRLSDEQERELSKMISSGRASARKLVRARILLKANENKRHQPLKDTEICQALEVCRATVYHVRKEFVLKGLQAALTRKPQPERPGKRKLDGDGEAYLIATACGSPPEGHSQWTLRLLGDRMVSLGFCDSIGRETVRQVLKKK